jgi:hypothetical protein
MIRSCGLIGGRAAAVFVGEFVTSGLAAFSGLVGGGVSQECVAAGCPAGTGVGEGADDEGGVVVGVVGGADGSVFGSGVVAIANPRGITAMKKVQSPGPRRI